MGRRRGPRLGARDEEEGRQRAGHLKQFSDRQPFTPPAVRPETIRRWKISTSTTSGTVTITEAAMMLPQGISNCELPESSAIATGTVRCVLVEVKVSANRNSF